MLDWKQLVFESDEQLATRDIAEVHLACAAGLPGAERLDVPAYLRIIDQYAERVRAATDRLWHFFEQKPEKFGHSWAYFRMLMMTTVFQRDLGFRTTGRANRADYKLLDSRDSFIHGLIEVKTGSCASHTVLYAAVGRRLNYPIKLVTSSRHLFARWDEPGGERLNAECTSNGFFSHPDDYYLRWPKLAFGNLWCLFVDGHFAIKVKLPDGQVFYFDDGNWGGAFREKDIPKYAR